MVVMGWVVGARRVERGSIADRSLTHGLLLRMGAAASLAPSTVEDAATDATGRFEISSVLIKSLGQVVAAGGSWVMARSIVEVLVDEVGCRV